MSDTKHVFALYIAPGSYTKHDHVITITAADTLTRIKKVLRLRAGDRLILFTDQDWYRLVLVSETTGTIEHASPITYLRPEVTFLLPLLEKPALESALYGAAVFGVRDIQLVTCAKSRKELRTSERERLEKVMRAACEQSKQYFLPVLREPLDIITSVQVLSARALKLFGDPQGSNFIQELQQHKALRETPVVLTVGPEGGFTTQELLLLGDNGFRPVSLGTSVLRACDAVGALLAVIRAYS